MRLLNFLQETFADALSILHSPEGLKSLYGVSLYRNAVYLMLTSGVSAVLGFAFWVMARLYSASDVGLGFGLGHCRTIDSPRIPRVELRAKSISKSGELRVISFDVDVREGTSYPVRKLAVPRFLSLGW